MGYTHYWSIDRPVTPQEIALLADDARKIIDVSGVSIRGWDGTGEPELGPDRVWLNGDADAHEACETFGITVGVNEWTFCKTRRKPYDTVVTAILLAAKDRLGDAMSLSSDGSATDWSPGLVLALRALRRVIIPAVEVVRS